MQLFKSKTIRTKGKISKYLTSLKNKRKLTGFSIWLDHDSFEVTLNFGPKTKMARGGNLDDMKNAIDEHVADMS